MKFFIHPIPLSAVALMAINDHWLKYRFPGLLTGKISDFCGIFYLPIFLLALLVGLRILRRRADRDSSAGRAAASADALAVSLTWKNLWIAIFITDLLLVSVKLSPVIASGIEHFFAEFLFQIRLIADPTDLLALLMNPLTILYMRPHLRSSHRV